MIQYKEEFILSAEIIDRLSHLLAVALNSILDFIMTSSGLACLQAEVTLTTGYLKILDKETLARN